MCFYRIYKEIEQKTMTPQKREESKDDWFSFYVGRKITYWMTIPFLNTNVTPNQITFVSIAILVLGFLINCFAHSQTLMIIAWSCYFLWGMFDGVDGNLARYKKRVSKLGDIYDSMGGYAAYGLMYLGMGIGAFFLTGSRKLIPSEYYIIIGAVSSLSCLFPRLMYQKIRAEFSDKKHAEQIRWHRSPLRILERNIGSITGGTMVFFLLGILLHCLDLLTMGYALLNTAKMVVSLYKIIKEVGSEE